MLLHVQCGKMTLTRSASPTDQLRRRGKSMQLHNVRDLSLLLLSQQHCSSKP